jgi:hypothetical protein
MVGSTDSHTSLATAEESNFFGKVVVLEPSADPIRFNEIIAGRPPKARRCMRGRPVHRAWPHMGAREHT